LNKISLDLNFAQIAWVVEDVEKAKTFFQEMVFNITKVKAQFNK
jgi:hypothetical protein